MPRPKKSTTSAATSPQSTEVQSTTTAPAPKSSSTKTTTTAASSSGRRFGWQFWTATIVAAALLLVANSAYWVNNYIFNTANFTRVAQTALTSESSRTAIAGEVVDRLLEQRPVLRNAIDEPAVKLISGLLGSNQASTVMDRVISRLHIAMTSANPQSIEVDLSRLKSIIQRIIDLANVEETKFDPNQIPDNIVLLDANKIPHFYQYGVMFLWLAPVAFFVSIGLLAWPYFRRTTSTWLLPLFQGIAVLVAGLVGLMLGPLFNPIVLAHVNSPNARIVVENVYNAFGATFVRQTYVLLILGAALCLVSLIWWLNNHRYLFRRGSSTQSTPSTT